MPGKSGYQEAGENFDQLNGSFGAVHDTKAIASSELILVSFASQIVVDYIDVYVETGSIVLYFDDGAKKIMLKAGVPGKIIYPGRYGLAIDNTMQISAQGVAVGADPGVGQVTVFKVLTLDQTANT
jgi:hypothetical protein